MFTVVHALMHVVGWFAVTMNKAGTFPCEASERGGKKGVSAVVNWWLHVESIYASYFSSESIVITHAHTCSPKTKTNKKDIYVFVQLRYSVPVDSLLSDFGT